MNSGYFVFAISVGFAAVLQGALNRRVAQAWGLPAVAMLNSLVVLAASLALYVAARNGLTGNDLFRHRAEAFSQMRWWHIAPGMLGLMIVLGLPLSISKLGAQATFALVVAGQMITGIMWDRMVEGIAISAWRLGGLLLVMAGAALVNVRS
ncbi:MAG: DMT family transporter [Deltaproteobacteria bacterium]|nr:DMT family transporter [Deltaproteobacteria bacterium]